MKHEEWRELPGYDGRYQVSNLGNFRSVSTNRCIHGRLTPIRRIKNLSLIDNGNGYLYVSISNGRKRKNVYIHRAVAEAFIPKEEGKNVVNHKDFNKKNNCVENLEWCSPKQNVQYSSHRMKKPKSICRCTNTGEKYITLKKGKYVFQIRGKIYKTFSDLSVAKKFKEMILNEKHCTTKF